MHAHELEEARRKIERIFAIVLERWKFMAVHHVRLDQSQLLAPGIDTARTDGIKIQYDPKFIMEEDEETLVNAHAHELGHNMFGHSYRLSLLLRNPRLKDVPEHEVVEVARQAAEHPLNGWMESNLGVLMPDWSLKEPRFVNLSFEEVFWVMWEERQQAKNKKPEPKPGQPGPQGEPGGEGQGQAEGDSQGEGQGKSESQPGDDQGGGQGNSSSDSGDSGSQDSGSSGKGKDSCGSQDGGGKGHSCGGLEPAKNEKQELPTKGELESKLEEVKDAISQSEIANRFGTDRVGMQNSKPFRRVMEDVDIPVHPKEILEQHMLQVSSKDTNMVWPHRFCAQDGAPFIPDQNLPEIGHLWFLVDTSGSMNDRALGIGHRCLKEVMETVRVSKITVVCVDTKVRSVTEIDVAAGEPFEFKPVGGGGTFLDSAFKKIEEMNEDVDLIAFYSDLKVRITDLQCEPDAPVVWLVPPGGRTDAPFGDIARLAHADY